MSDIHRMKVAKNKMENVFDLLNKAKDSRHDSEFDTDTVLKTQNCGRFTENQCIFVQY